MHHAQQFLYSKRGPREQFQWWSSRPDAREGDRYRAVVKDGRDAPLRMFCCLPREGRLEAVTIARDPVESSRDIRFYSALRVAVTPAEEIVAAGGVSALWHSLDAAQRGELPGDVALAVVLPPACEPFGAEAERVFFELATKRAATSDSLAVASALLDALPVAMLTEVTCLATRGEEGWSVRLTRRECAAVQLGAARSAELASSLRWLRDADATWSELTDLFPAASDTEAAWCTLRTAWSLEARAGAATPDVLSASIGCARAAMVEQVAGGAFPEALDDERLREPLAALYGEAVERALAEPSNALGFARRIAEKRGAMLLRGACTWLTGRERAQSDVAAVCVRAAVLREALEVEALRSAFERAPVRLAPMLCESLRALLPEPGDARAAFIAALRGMRVDERVSCMAAAVVELAHEPDEALTLVEVLLGDERGDPAPAWAAELVVAVACAHGEYAAPAGEALARLHAASALPQAERQQQMARLPRRARSAYERHAPRAPTRVSGVGANMRARLADGFAGAALGAAVTLTAVVLTLGWERPMADHPARSVQVVPTVVRSTRAAVQPVRHQEEETADASYGDAAEDARTVGGVEREAAMASRRHARSALARMRLAQESR